MIAQLRSSRRRRCHVAVATCERKSVQAGASAHEWSRPQHDDHAVAIVMLLLSPRGCCERVGVGRLGGRREGKGCGNVRASVHVVVVPMWLLRGRGRGEGKGRGEVHVRVRGADEGVQAVHIGRRGRPCMSEGRTRLCSSEGRRAVRVGRQGTSEAQLRLERGPYEAQTERWYHFG
jgi:hypothetical protein